MYFWGEPDASIHFCEDKYKEVEWIAEYYNTLSSFLYILVGMFFLNTKISKIAWSLIGVGVGSIMLHATLRYYGQWADELFMLTTSFHSLQYIRPRIRTFLLSILILFYLIFNKIFIVFFFFFILMNLPLLYITFKRNSLWGRLYVFSFVCGCYCWVLDQFACFYFQDYQLHAWWHVFTSIGLFFALIELLNHKKN